jgi:hypothetical protein
MSSPSEIEVAKSDSRNAGILRYLQDRQSGLSGTNRDLPWSCSPESVSSPYLHLGTHPELVAHLWDEITEELPVSCKWVLFGTPVLVRPESGIVFGFAGGSSIYALRLALPERLTFDSAVLARAIQWADKRGLKGRDRERYLLAQSGNIWEFNGGSTLDLSTIGEEWRFGRWVNDARFCRSAFDYSG